jgi:hypothetical protein
MLAISIGSAAALLALAACNSNKGGADATATDTTATTAADTDVGMGGAIATDTGIPGTPTDMAPMGTETGTSTMRGPGTAAPTDTATNGPTP